MTKVTPTDGGLIFVALLLLVVIVLGVLFYVGALSSAKSTDQKIDVLVADSASHTIAVQSLQGKVAVLSSQQDALLPTLQQSVASLVAQPRLTAMVAGNNGSVACPTFCNNVSMFGLRDQVPSMPKWRGASSVNLQAVNGVCDCVEDPSHPLNTLPIEPANSPSALAAVFTLP
jgi:hypothetical protein